MNEAETRAELIDPALKEAGWGVVDGSRVRREERITLGRLQGGGRRSKEDIADYVLVYRNQKLAVIEAKRRDAAVTEGLAQAKKYSEKLHPFISGREKNLLRIYKKILIPGKRSFSPYGMKLRILKNDYT